MEICRMKLEFHIDLSRIWQKMFASSKEKSSFILRTAAKAHLISMTEA